MTSSNERTSDTGMQERTGLSRRDFLVREVQRWPFSPCQILHCLCAWQVRLVMGKSSRF